MVFCERKDASKASLKRYAILVRSGGALVSISQVNLRRSRLILGWVTVSVFNSRYRTFISVCNQLSRTTQPGHHMVGTRNEY